MPHQKKSKPADIYQQIERLDCEEKEALWNLLLEKGFPPLQGMIAVINEHMPRILETAMTEGVRRAQSHPREKNAARNAEIRQRRKSGWSWERLVKHYKMPKSTIRSICNPSRRRTRLF